MWLVFHNTLCDSITLNTEEKLIPKKAKKPWINKNLLQMVKGNKHLWTKYRCSRNQQDLRDHRNLAKRLTTMIRNSRKNFENKLANDKNPKKFFKYSHSFIKSRVFIPMLNKTNNLMCQNEEQVAEELAKTFEQAFTKDSQHDVLPTPQCPRIMNTISAVNITEEQIKQKIQKLKNDSAAVLDMITVNVLKKCCEVISVPLAKIMKYSLNKNSVPEQWKVASVTPIFKKGDKLLASNYRPISLVSNVCKVMESIIRDEVQIFFSENNVISDIQHGFVKGRSTITNMLQCLDNWISTLDKKFPMDVIYLDFAKAFDRVPRRRLLHKLEHLGVRGDLLNWIGDFLKGRRFSVRVGGTMSSFHPVCSGVPQGSVLGPLLFLAYTCDLPLQLKCWVSMFADDTKMYAVPLTSHAMLQADLDVIWKWCSDWLLPLNAEKCVVLHLGKNNPQLSYYINNVNLKKVDSYCDLGIVVTKDLSWSQHIASIVKRANSMLYLLQKTFVKISFHNFVKLYKTFVRPIIEPAWCADLVRDRNLLESLQRRATRSTYSLRLPRPSYHERLSNAQLLTFEKGKPRGNLIFTFRIMNNFVGCDLTGLFVRNLDERLRGHGLKLKKQNYKTNTRQLFLPNRVFNVWNSLPSDVITAPSVNSFKNRLDKLGMSCV